MFLNQTMHSLKYSLNTNKRTNHSIWFKLFSSNQWSLYSHGFSPIPVMDDSCSQKSQHTKHTQSCDNQGHSGFTQVNPFHHESIYNLLFLGWRGILIEVEWVVKHYWLGDELQQEYLILVFFVCQQSCSTILWKIVSSP
jgi:hypothetical protein